jgi:chromosome condensin MukBEF ATPase and DNA-binding subunit MukB
MQCRKSDLQLLRRSSLRGLPAVWRHALLSMALLMLGVMQVSSQNSDPKLSGSIPSSQTFELNSETLNKLHNQASNQLTELTQNLNQASEELQTSKVQLISLQSLLDSALKKSVDLENTNQRISELNQQIGERMQEADEWNAELNDDLNLKDKQILKMWIAIAVLGLVCLGFIAFGVIKLLIKLHIL